MFNWKSEALYLQSIYIGKVMTVFPFEKGSDPRWAAILQTLPHGHTIGLYPSLCEAKAALIQAAEAAMAEPA